MFRQVLESVRQAIIKSHKHRRHTERQIPLFIITDSCCYTEILPIIYDLTDNKNFHCIYVNNMQYKTFLFLVISVKQ